MYFKLYMFKMNFKIYYYIYLKPILINEGKDTVPESFIISLFWNKIIQAFVVNPPLTIEQKQQYRNA